MGLPESWPRIHANDPDGETLFAYEGPLPRAGDRIYYDQREWEVERVEHQLAPYRHRPQAATRPVFIQVVVTLREVAP